MAKKIDSEKAQPITHFWQNYERAEPTTVSLESPNTAPPNHFSVNVFETDMNDSFDEAALLRKVPKLFFKKAQRLLQAFDQRPNELTWDASGNIYIDEKVIPNANIRMLFPLLFSKKQTKTKIPVGMADFVQKLLSMDLGSLISKACVDNYKLYNVTKTDSSKPTSETKTNWWYLGE